MREIVCPDCRGDRGTTTWCNTCRNKGKVKVVPIEKWKIS